MDSKEFALHAALEDSHWWFTGRRTVLADILRRFVPPAAGRLLAEIGCGTGGNLKSLRSDYRVIGCDKAHDAVAHARQRVDCPVFEGDFSEVFAPYSHEIDAILLLDVLEHIEDDALFMGRIVDFLQPGGILFMTVPAHMALWSSHDESLGHKRRYGAEELKNLWKHLQVDTLFFSPINSILFPLIALYRILGFGGGGGGKSNLKESPHLINRFLYHVFAIERYWLKRRVLPFGGSYCAVLRKRGVEIVD